jgi:glycosyltransferase involved in cell wall biosynthesis
MGLIRTLNVYTFTKGGGAQKVFEATCSGLKDEAGIYSYSASHEPSADLILRKSLFGILNAYKLFRFLKLNDIDVLHLHGGLTLGAGFPIAALLARRWLGIRTVMTLHNYAASCPSQKRYNYSANISCDKCARAGLHYFVNNCEDGRYAPHKRLMKWSYFLVLRTVISRFDCLIVPSLFSAQTIEKRVGLQVEVVPNPYDAILAVHETGDSLTTRDEICFVGRLVPEKGIHLLLRTVRENASFFSAHALNIIGSGPEHKIIIDFCRAHPELNIVLHGYQDAKQIRKILNRCKVVVIPSVWDETFGLVVVEAALQHCIPVVSNGGALPEVIGTLGAGETFNTGDAHDLFEHVKNAVESYNFIDWGKVEKRAALAYCRKIYIRKICTLYHESYTA